MIKRLALRYEPYAQKQIFGLVNSLCAKSAWWMPCKSKICVHHPLRYWKLAKSLFGGNRI